MSLTFCLFCSWIVSRFSPLFRSCAARLWNLITRLNSLESSFLFLTSSLFTFYSATTHTALVATISNGQIRRQSTTFKTTNRGKSLIIKTIVWRLDISPMLTLSFEGNRNNLLFHKQYNTQRNWGLHVIIFMRTMFLRMIWLRMKCNFTQKNWHSL